MPVSIVKQDKKAKVKEKKNQELVVLFPAKQNCIQQKFFDVT